MFGYLKNKLLSGSNRSKSVAKSRLHFVLVQDRSGLTPEEMAEFKKEMVAVIKKFFIIDDKGVEIEYQRDSGSTTLLINSPVLRKRAAGDVSQKKESKKKVVEAAEAAQV